MKFEDWFSAILEGIAVMLYWGVVLIVATFLLIVLFIWIACYVI